MVDVSSPGGSRFPSIHFSAAAVGATLSGFTLVGFAFGFMTAYRVATTGMDQLKTWHTEDQAHFETLATTIIADRETLSSRLTILEADTKYTAQGIADLKELTKGTGTRR